MTDSTPPLPTSSYQCADWPPPPNKPQQSDVALWLTQIYDAYCDCKQALAAAGQAGLKE